VAKKLGAMLVEASLITEEQLKEALECQMTQGGRLGSNLIKLGMVEEDELRNFLSKQHGVSTVDLDHAAIDPVVVNLITPSVAKQHHIMPVSKSGNVLTIAMVDPLDIFAIEDVKFMTGLNVVPMVTTESQIHRKLEEVYGLGDSGTEGHLAMVLQDMEQGEDLAVLADEDEDLNIGDIKKAMDDAPVVKLVNFLLMDAIDKRVSDVHIEPYEKVLRIRYRIDGVLQEVMKPPYSLKDAITSRIKIMAELDIAERRLPQDGRIKLRTKGREVDIRVSTIPTIFGEKTVMRLLDKGNLMVDLQMLGFDQQEMDVLVEAIHAPFGMVLVTGPTGSGKSTTLYSALSQLNKVSENIMTAEDPVEYNLMGINQCQMKDKIGYNFAAALRSFLRQDPDIIMVGEIRDLETAEIAIKAALTGHLVLSTLHTNDAPSTVNRMLNMGVEPFLVTSSVNLILAQRLARRVCSQCKVETPTPREVLLQVGFTPKQADGAVIYQGTGCDQCGDTGYKGRVGLYELFKMTDRIREIVLRGGSAIDIKAAAVVDGMRTLRMAGIRKIIDGITTIEEVLRVSMSDER
jgi:type IV pilus assembly protein PilB